MINRRNFVVSAFNLALCKTAAGGLLASRKTVRPSAPPELLAMLAAAKNNPTGDLPRLLLADWLENHGQCERATFVRMQLELARLPRGERGTEHYRQLDAVETSLELRCRDSWLASLPDSLRHAVSFMRGLVQLTLHGAEELEIVASTDVWPWVQWVWVEREPWEPTPLDLAFVRKVQASPLLADVRQLAWAFCHMDDNGAAVVAQSPQLTGLWQLELNGNIIGPRGAAALAASPYLGGLHELDFSCNGVGDEGAVALATSPLLRRLVRLCLTDNQIGDKGAAALTASPHFVNLAVLEVPNNEIGPNCMAALTSFAHRRGVEVWVGDWYGDDVTKLVK